MQEERRPRPGEEEDTPSGQHSGNSSRFVTPSHGSSSGRYFANRSPDLSIEHRAYLWRLKTARLHGVVGIKTVLDCRRFPVTRPKAVDRRLKSACDEIVFCSGTMEPRRIWKIRRRHEPIADSEMHVKVRGASGEDVTQLRSSFEADRIVSSLELFLQGCETAWPSTDHNNSPPCGSIGTTLLRFGTIFSPDARFA